MLLWSRLKFLISFHSQPEIPDTLGNAEVTSTYTGSIGDHVYGDPNIIDPMSQMSLNGSSALTGSEHTHIHSLHTQPSNSIDIEPVSQFAPVVVSFMINTNCFILLVSIVNVSGVSEPSKQTTQLRSPFIEPREGKMQILHIHFLQASDAPV